MKVYQLHIQLNNIYPAIWRRIVIPSYVRLDDLHRILQTVFGWANSHLHQFDTGSEAYAPLEFEIEDTKNSRKVQVEEILKHEGSTIQYEYDFGDGWVHTLALEKIFQFDGEVFVSQCIAGERSGPPEDCGGVFGFQQMLEILKNPKHEKYLEYKAWVGRNFNPEKFDLNKVNKLLQKKDYGCEWIQ